MITIQRFVFNEFQTNTYVLHDQTRECIIVDAACNSIAQWEELNTYIKNNNLIIKEMVQTHCHTDHLLGCHYVTDNYGIGYRIHSKGQFFLGFASDFGKAYQINVGKIYDPIGFIEEGNTLAVGHSKLEVLYTPGHAEGSLCFYSPSEGFVISGDVLFKESIGRTDLPTGNYNTLKESIEKKLFSLPESTLVYPGHGPATTIGHEKLNNPFL